MSVVEDSAIWGISLRPLGDLLNHQSRVTATTNVNQTHTCFQFEWFQGVVEGVIENITRSVYKCLLHLVYVCETLVNLIAKYACCNVKS